MARAPLLQITGLSLGYGGPPLFDGLDLVVQAGDRLALVGRNGSGKSTLMKVMAGLVEPDAGARVLPEGTGVGYLEQDPDFAGFATLGDFATASLGASETWRVEAAAEGLDLSLDMAPDRASGGERRRAALARLLAEAPDLMLLDEPTNHLDIAAIGWLEAELSRTRAAFITISHDRAFLRRLARATLWLDRGVVRRMDRPFDDSRTGATEYGPRRTSPDTSSTARSGKRRAGPSRASPPGASATRAGCGSCRSCGRPARR
jgi:ATP-binding cassette subfamily F protein uup